MTKKTRSNKWTRRAFIAASGILGTGLVVGVGGYAYISRQVKKYSGKGMGDGASMNAWIRIAPDNSITVAVARAEMGQGITTALPQLIAEELEVDITKIKVIHPQPESPYANTFMVTQKQPNVFKGYDLLEKVYAFIPVIATGGSTSTSDGWNNMRYAGATAREMLITAAARRWNVDPSECYAENAHVINRQSMESISYGELSEEASKIELHSLPELKKREDYKVIGKPVHRLDIPSKVDGSALFGLDVRLEGMLYASVKHPSTIGGKITAITNEAEILAMNGVKKIVITEFGPAAVIADNSWNAISASRTMEVEEASPNAGLNTDQISAEMDRILNEKPGAVPESHGDVEKTLASEEGHLEALYEVPYLAHATMEPMNCTVRISENDCEAWLGHQAPSVVQTVLSEVSGIDKENVTVNTLILGGGFGRRSEPDFVRIAAAVAKEMRGTPVQTLFTREEDMKNDMYRPMAKSRFRAKLGPNGKIEAWDNMFAVQSVSNSAMSRIMPSMAPSPKKDPSTPEGAVHLPYEMMSRRVGFGDISLPIQCGYWRSVGNSQNAFFVESFMDECAHAAGIDPYQFRRTKLDAEPRFAAVLDKVAEMSNWSDPMPEGKYRGIAMVKSFGSIVAEVAEITRVDSKTFKINKYYCAIDCGNYVNPDTIQAQMEGGIVFGLTAALYGEISWQNGAVKQSNFPDYEMVRMSVCPKVEVHIMDVDDYPGGVGEPATPPAAPALANAIFAAAGERIRALPFTKSGIRFV